MEIGALLMIHILNLIIDSGDFKKVTLYLALKQIIVYKVIRRVEGLEQGG